MLAKATVAAIPGGIPAILTFVVALCSFVVESELTEYVQNSLGYHRPFFIFYLVHTSFVIIFPLHLLYLAMTTDKSAHILFRDLISATAQHLAGPGPRKRFPWSRFLFLVLGLTAGLTVPALLWFASISLAPVTDVTAIWNTNAFFAYIISVKVFHLTWQTKRLLAVCLATAGVAAVVYGGSRKKATEAVVGTFDASPAPLVGILLTLLASISSGLYQVLYKKYAALPSDPDELVVGEEAYTQLPEADTQADSEAADADDAVCAPPFGLHSTFLTMMIGVCTFLVLWVPIPLLHRAGVEPFSPPGDLKTIFAIAGIALSGVGFNGAFMVLLGLWGPIITSVGGLLTIVLVFLSDVVIRGAKEVITFYSVVGCGAIVAAFGVLAHDMYRSR